MIAQIEVKERPVIFSGPMVKAILEGRKTQTRRICKPACDMGGELAGSVHPAKESGWIAWWPGNDPGLADFTKLAYQDGFQCPYGKPGERLWVRESAYISQPNFGLPEDATHKDYDGQPRVVSYTVDMGFDAKRCAQDYGVKCSPSIHMPRWASRITLEITSVKVERLQEISDEDCKAEGIEHNWLGSDPCPPEYADEWERYGSDLEAEPCYSPKESFQTLWETIHGPDSWATNPWLWCISFRRIEQ
jgi:hypothetical protein